MIGWLFPIGIALAFVGIVALAKTVQQRRDRRVADTVTWPEVEATVGEGQLAYFDRHHDYPCMTFSYVVGQDYQSGQFWLQAETDQVDEVIKNLRGTRFTINYDPARPSSWYIPQSSMESYPIVFPEP